MIYSEPLISKQTFVKIINVMRDREDLVVKLNDIIRDYKVTLHDDFLDGNALVIGGEEEILELLEILMRDTCGDISYFMWEIDFGRDYEPGCITHDDKNIDLSSADKLYDYLVKINFEHEEL